MKIQDIFWEISPQISLNYIKTFWKSLNIMLDFFFFNPWKFLIFSCKWPKISRQLPAEISNKIPQNVQINSFKISWKAVENLPEISMNIQDIYKENFPQISIKSWLICKQIPMKLPQSRKTNHTPQITKIFHKLFEYESRFPVLPMKISQTLMEILDNSL